MYELLLMAVDLDRPTCFNWLVVGGWGEVGCANIMMEATDKYLQSFWYTYQYMATVAKKPARLS